jgi:DNA-binding MarR family transcriptional regulator
MAAENYPGVAWTSRDIIAESSNSPNMVMASSARNKDYSSDPILKHWRDAVPHDRLAHLVKDATRSLVRGLQMRLAQHEVSFGHWTFLRILWEQDGITQRELSDQAGVMTPTTFSAVTAMEKLGYVVRRQRPDNKKNVHVYLTPKGRALKKKLVPLAEEVNRIGVKGLKVGEIEIARKVLLTVIENMAIDESRSDDPARRIISTRELGSLIAARSEELNGG